MVHQATLPNGVVRGGKRRRDALLRPPTGADEAMLVDNLAGASAAARVSALLAACVERLGGEPCGLEEVRALTVGDRESLLLHLRAAAFGERLLCVLDCPACEEQMDLELAVSDLLVEPYADAAETGELAVPSGETVRFRLPSGADQELAAAAPDAAEGTQLLLERCVLGPALEDPADAEALAAEIGRLDPQAELRLDARCPACGEPIDAMLDAGSLLLGELAAGADGLFREVHVLARHYHWSEDEILGLDLTRRRRYLDLLVADEAPEGVALWAAT